MTPSQLVNSYRCFEQSCHSCLQGTETYWDLHTYVPWNVRQYWAAVVASFLLRLEPSSKRFDWIGTYRERLSAEFGLNSLKNYVQAFRKKFELNCPELIPVFRSSIVCSFLKCIFHFTSGSVLLPYAWGNECEAEIMDVDQQKRECRVRNCRHDHFRQYVVWIACSSGSSELVSSKTLIEFYH